MGVHTWLYLLAIRFVSRVAWGQISLWSQHIIPSMKLFSIPKFKGNPSSRQMFYDKGGILHARKLSGTKGLIRNRANLDLVCSIYNA